MRELVNARELKTERKQDEQKERTTNPINSQLATIPKFEIFSPHLAARTENYVKVNTEPVKNSNVEYRVPDCECQRRPEIAGSEGASGGGENGGSDGDGVVENVNLRHMPMQIEFKKARTSRLGFHQVIDDGRQQEVPERERHRGRD